MLTARWAASCSVGERTQRLALEQRGVGVRDQHRARGAAAARGHASIAIRTACPVPCCSSWTASTASGTSSWMCGADLLALVADHRDDPQRRRLLDRRQHVADHAPPRHRVQHLHGLGLHPGAATGGQDDDGQVAAHVTDHAPRVGVEPTSLVLIQSQAGPAGRPTGDRCPSVRPATADNRSRRAGSRPTAGRDVSRPGRQVRRAGHNRHDEHDSPSDSAADGLDSARPDVGRRASSSGRPDSCDQREPGPEHRAATGACRRVRPAASGDLGRARADRRLTRRLPTAASATCSQRSGAGPVLCRRSRRSGWHRAPSHALIEARSTVADDTAGLVHLLPVGGARSQPLRRPKPTAPVPALDCGGLDRLDQRWCGPSPRCEAVGQSASLRSGGAD